MSEQFTDEVEILEDRIIIFLKEKYNVVITGETELCCPDKIRKEYIKESNGDINIYKDLLIDYYKKIIIGQPHIMDDLILYANNSVQSLEVAEEARLKAASEMRKKQIDNLKANPTTGFYDAKLASEMRKKQIDNLKADPTTGFYDAKLASNVASEMRKKQIDNLKADPTTGFYDANWKNRGGGGRKKSKRRKHSKKRRQSRKRRHVKTKRRR